MPKEKFGIDKEQNGGSGLLVILELSIDDMIDESCFSKEENEEINRFKRKEDRLCKAASILLCSNYLNKPIEIGKFGKPFVHGGPYFSLSHSFPFVVLAIFPCSVGVDVEVKKPWDTKMDDFCFSPSERGLGIDPLKLWTLKEASYKVMGNHPFEALKEEVNPIGDDRLLYLGQELYYFDFEDEIKELSLVYDGKINRLNIDPASLPLLIKNKENRL